MSIKFKVLAILAAVMGISGSGGALVLWMIFGEAASIQDMTAQTAHITNHDMPLIGLLSDLRHDVQAMQNTVLAARLGDGTNQGESVALAGQQAQAFSAHLTAALDLCREHDEPKTFALLSALEEDFARYRQQVQILLVPTDQPMDAIFAAYNTAATALTQSLTRATENMNGIGAERLQDLTKQGAGVADDLDAIIFWVIFLAALGSTIGLSGGVLIFQMIRRMVDDIASDVSTVEHRSDHPLRLLARGDELTEIGQALQHFRNDLLEVQRLQQQQVESKEQADQDRRVLLQTLADDLEHQVQSAVSVIAGSCTEMHATAEAMSETATDTSRYTREVSVSAGDAAANVQTVAAAADQLAASIAEISQQVDESSRISQQAVARADETNSTIQGLSVAAERISEVVLMITDIAEQTNLLALNATIEAARAGEAGKGFAVVANEVKNLATQTSRATGEIAGQINAVQDQTRLAVGAIKDISDTIRQIHHIATAIAGAVQEQGTATQKIANNVQLASEGTFQVTQTIATVSSAADETGQAANQVLVSAETLNGQATTLASIVARSLSSIRAA